MSRKAKGIAPHWQTMLNVTSSYHEATKRKRVTLSPQCVATIKSWTSSFVYVVVASDTVQYVGICKNFYRRFTDGLRKAHATGYKWPQTGKYKLFLWDISQHPPHFWEALEAEIAFVHRAVLGDWPIELNRIAPKRFLVHGLASTFGKRAAFGIYHWLLSAKHIARTPNDRIFLRALEDRSVVVGDVEL